MTRPLPLLALLVLALGVTLDALDILPPVADLLVSLVSVARVLLLLTSPAWAKLSTLERAINLLEPLA